MNIDGTIAGDGEGGGSKLPPAVPHTQLCPRSADALTAMPPAYSTGGHSKRLFDILVSGAALVFCLPLLAVTTLAVKLTSTGPALFWTARADNRGGTFMMPKFRSMTYSAPVMPREQLASAGANMTPPGEWLRKTSIDELPQLLCILTGRMSLIGPRPLLPSDPTLVQRARLGGCERTRPGLTGLAQVKGRNNLTPRQKARYDRFYATHWSWRLDLWILARTVKVVITRAGVL